MTKTRSFAITLIATLALSGAALAQSNGRGGDGGNGGGGVEITTNPHVALVTTPGANERLPNPRGRNGREAECQLQRQMGGFSDGGYTDANCRRN